MNKKIMICNFLIMLSGQIQTAQVSISSLEPIIDALSSNVVSIRALSAVAAKISASSVAGLMFFIAFTDAQGKSIWAKNYTVMPDSLKAINQVVQSEGAVYIFMTPISNLSDWRVNYAVYGAKSFNLIDSQTFELNFEKSGQPVPTA